MRSIAKPHTLSFSDRGAGKFSIAAIARYAGDAAIPAYAQYAGISAATAKTVRDRFYPKAMLQLDEVAGLPELMQDAIAFKYIPKELDRAQLEELVQTKVKPK